jgi:hypothetical protein
MSTESAEQRAARFSRAARGYSELGWALVRLNGKVPVERRWQRTRRVASEFAAGMWSQWGHTANLGVLLGPSGLVVVEPDTSGARETLLGLLGGTLPAVPTVLSGDKSVHLYFSDANHSNAVREGLELRAGMQQCVAPPSIHPATGRPYVWLAGRTPWDVDLAPVPEEVLAFFSSAKPTPAVPIEKVITEGSRHRTLLSLAGSMRRRGMTGPEIRAALSAVNESRCRPPLSNREISDLARDVARRYEPAPRDRPVEIQPRPVVSLSDADPGWERPVPLPVQPDVPPFPLHVLPNWLGTWAEAIATEKGAAIDLAASLGLGVSSGGLARHVQVSPRPGWDEPVNLYLATGLDPGQRKTPLFKEALRPVRLLERELVADWRQHEAFNALGAEVLKKRRQDLVREAAEDDEIGSDQLRNRFEAIHGELDDSVEVPQPRILTEDVTAEGLAALLAQHGRIIAASDEGSAIFENFAGRYTRGSTSWDLFNKAHAAADLVVDRKSSEAVIVLDPALTLVLATQPAVLRELWAKPGTEGRGVLARPLYSLPKPVYVTGPTDAADAAILAEYDTRIRALFVDVPTLRIDDRHRPQPITLRFDPESREIFERFELEVAVRREELGTSDRAHQEGAYLGWLSKLAGQTTRLAAVLHACEHWTNGSTLNQTISSPTVVAAIELARYFHAHAAAAFGLMGELPDQRLAKLILDWLRRRPNNELATLTVRDVHRSRGHGVTVDEVHGALRLLEEHGFVKIDRRSSGHRGGRPMERVTLHPDIRSFSTRDRQNRQNLLSEPVLSVLSVRPTLKHRNPRCEGTEFWLARDGSRRCALCEPAAFPAEVLPQADVHPVTREEAQP